eukprot:15333282-Ditylum_brightwellii.AAC.1
MQYVLTPNFRLYNHPMETIEYLLYDCAGTQPYCTNHDLIFDTLVSKTKQYIYIAHFNTWLRDVFSFFTRPPTYWIAATVKAMASDQHKEGKDSRMNPRKCQKMVMLGKSLNITINSSKYKERIGTQ